MPEAELTRREFLQTSATAAIASAAPPVLAWHDGENLEKDPIKRLNPEDRKKLLGQWEQLNRQWNTVENGKLNLHQVGEKVANGELDPEIGSVYLAKYAQEKGIGQEVNPERVIGKIIHQRAGLMKALEGAKDDDERLQRAQKFFFDKETSPEINGAQPMGLAFNKFRDLSSDDPFKQGHIQTIDSVLDDREAVCQGLSETVSMITQGTPVQMRLATAPKHIVPVFTNAAGENTFMETTAAGALIDEEFYTQSQTVGKKDLKPISPADAFANNLGNYSVALTDNQNYLEALQNYKLMKGLSPNDRTFDWSIAMCQKNLGRPDIALKGAMDSTRQEHVTGQGEEKERIFAEMEGIIKGPPTGYNIRPFEKDEFTRMDKISEAAWKGDISQEDKDWLQRRNEHYGRQILGIDKTIKDNQIKLAEDGEKLGLNQEQQADLARYYGYVMGKTLIDSKLAPLGESLGSGGIRLQGGQCNAVASDLMQSGWIIESDKWSSSAIRKYEQELKMTEASSPDSIPTYIGLAGSLEQRAFRRRIFMNKEPRPDKTDLDRPALDDYTEAYRVAKQGRQMMEKNPAPKGFEQAHKDVREGFKQVEDRSLAGAAGILSSRGNHKAAYDALKLANDKNRDEVVLARAKVLYAAGKDELALAEIDPTVEATHTVLHPDAQTTPRTEEFHFLHGVIMKKKAEEALKAGDKKAAKKHLIAADWDLLNAEEIAKKQDSQRMASYDNYKASIQDQMEYLDESEKEK